MIEIRLFMLILLSSVVACCQSNKMFSVNELTYKGIIVTKDVNIFVDDKSDWFKPTLTEVKNVEQLLKEHITELNNEKINQVGQECPDIEKNLKKYIRQYIGYINNYGEKVILINLLWKDGVDYEDYSSEFVIVLDGCSHYWKVKANLSSGKLFDLEINGSS